MEKVKGLVFVALGLMMTFGAIAATINVQCFVRSSVIADGQVVRLNAGGSHPEIAFTTRDGKLVSYPQGGWIGGYAVGDHVTVRYDASDPSQSADIDRFGALYALPLFLALMGVGFVYLGATHWLAVRRG